MSDIAQNLLSQRTVATNPFASATTFDGKQHVTFHIDQQLFAASMEEVGDIVDVEELTPVPRSDDTIRGLINVRGQILTLIDLRTFFGQKALPFRKNEAAITFEYRGEGYALAVDQVKDIISLNEASLQTNLPNLSKTIRTCSKGIYRLDKSLVLVLSMTSTMQLVVHKARRSKSDAWADIIEQTS